MGNILVFNSGSTSIKYVLFDGQEKQLQGGSFNEVQNYEKTIKKILREIKGIERIEAIGHRVVHGGDKFIMPTVVTEKNLLELEEYNYLAPLHNPYNLEGIKVCLSFLPNIPQIAVFDTAFFADLPAAARRYALPREVADKYNIKRFGFHGTSHKFAALEAAKILGKSLDKLNLITCHLGGGWSITAIKKGIAIDTSMGFTPLEGLVMITRAGDLDPGIIIELIKKSGKTTAEEAAEEVSRLLNQESGIKGLSGLADFQKLLREVSQGEEEARFAFTAAIYKLIKYIGSYWAVLEGQVDAIILTGAIGAGNPMTKNAIKNKLKFLGPVEIISLKTDEELMIAREVKKLAESQPQ